MNIWIILSIITFVIALYFSFRKCKNEREFFYTGILTLFVFALAASLLNVGMLVNGLSQLAK